MRSLSVLFCVSCMKLVSMVMKRLCSHLRVWFPTCEEQGGRGDEHAFCGCGMLGGMGYTCVCAV